MSGTVTAHERGLGIEIRAAARSAARTCATVTLVGIVCGWLVAGVLGRLAMMLLAVLNPRIHGVTSDDGFEIGQFTVGGTLNLVFLAGTFLGILGAGLYCALRGLRVGPPWFRLLSISVGAGVVVGSQLVHTTGVDFTALEPLWLAVALFVALPMVYVALVSLVSERLLARDRPLPTALAVLGLAPWLVAFPLLPLLLAVIVGTVAVELAKAGRGPRLAVSPVLPWLLRAGLAVVFVLALGDLVADVRELA